MTEPTTPVKSPPPAENSAGRPLGGTRRVFYAVIGCFFMVIGAAGAILPLLPATPFLLLSSYFFVRSWPAANERLLRSRLLGGILRDWQRHRGVRRDVKAKSIVIVAAAVAVSLYATGYSPILNGLIVGLALAGVAVILRLPEVT